MIKRAAVLVTFIALVCGLPAYVLIKVFQPAFFSREDTRTPVWTALGALLVNVGAMSAQCEGPATRAAKR